MTQRTVHWLECDHGHCQATYTQERQRQHNHRMGRRATLRQAARNDGWDQDDEGHDLCIYHAEQRLGERDRPALFAVPDADHGM